MLHCLSVIDATHLRDSRDAHASLCGLKMAAPSEPLAFVGADTVPSCSRCQALARPAPDTRTTPVLGPKSIVLAVLEYGLSCDDPHAAATLVASGDRKRFLDAAMRLRTLFPGWSAQVLTLIAEGNRLFATYRVSFADPNYLLEGEVDAAASRPMTLTDSAIFEIIPGEGVQDILGRVQPVNDRFGIWESAGLAGDHPRGEHHVG